MLTTPDIAKRQEKRIEEGDELATRQRAGASVHLELEENTLLTAGTASRRGTRLSSIPILSGTLSPSIDLKKRQIWGPVAKLVFTRRCSPVARSNSRTARPSAKLSGRHLNPSS